MVHCCVPGCKNTHHHKNKRDEWGGQDTRNYSLHDLPSEERMEVRDLWIMAINRTTLPKDVAVCSDHFTEDCFDEKWEEYKRKYGPTKVKRKLKADAVPTIFPGRIFIHEKVQRIKETWKNKTLQKQLEMERLRIEREYKDRFKFTQTECTCKCKCKQKRKNFAQQVNFSFKFMEDVGTQFPIDIQQTVKDEHSYGRYKKKNKEATTTNTTTTTTTKGKSPKKETTKLGVDEDDEELSPSKQKQKTVSTGTSPPALKKIKLTDDSETNVTQPLPNVNLALELESALEE